MLYAGEKITPKGVVFVAIRTDLAVELAERATKCEGVSVENLNLRDIDIRRVHIHSKKGAEALGKPQGKYVTLHFGGFTPESQAGELRSCISAELRSLLGNPTLTLVAGLGNLHITPDALGPRVADGIFATRHISRELSNELGLGNLQSVVALSPGVLGQTGIEAGELIAAAVKKTGAEAVIAIDALAARDIKRLGCTVQLTNAGICPGSGVENSRKELSAATLGVPVVAIGVPTVVDISTFFEEETGNEYSGNSSMMVTPKDIDMVIENAAKTIAHAINCTLQPNLSETILLALEY